MKLSKKETGVCSKCGERKPIEDFYKDQRTLDGLTCWCKDCYARYEKSEKGKAVSRKFHKEYCKSLHTEIVKAYGGKCVFCGETVSEWLTIDHINGKVERSPGGHRVAGFCLYARLRKLGYPKEEHRLLCCNCNQCRENYGEDEAKKLGRQKKKEREELNRLRKKLKEYETKEKE